jgi:F-type H+-transporting ATPase subunit epsilon
MLLEIVTPDKKVFSGEINLIQLPGANGSFELLNNHAPIVSVLQRGRIKVHTENNDELFYEIEGGVVELSNNKIIVLAEMFHY